MKMEKILIYDIECKTLEGKPNAQTDELKVFGCYSYITNKYYVLTDLKDIRQVINSHDIFVGFNTFFYDNQVLSRYFDDLIVVRDEDNAYFKYKTNIDLYDVFQKRAGSMKIKAGMLKDLLMSYSLDYITQTLELVTDDGKITDFDYDLLNKEIWSIEEWNTIEFYSKRDIEITKKLYDWIENYFESFKHYLPEKDITTKKYITCSIASFVYKVFCYKMGKPETYCNYPEKEDFGGGYVAYPAGEYFEGDIYCLDFNSLYPSIFHQCNLSAQVSDGWNGTELFKVDGCYDNKVLCEESKLLRQFYEERLIFKKNKDPREYTNKIIINTYYGMKANAVFEQFYDITAASDCTKLGRQWVKYSRNIFKENGYKIIYTDTDSVYLLDVFHDKERLINVKNNIIETIKQNVPFPYEYFDMGIDEEISHIWFFKGSISDKDSDIEMDEDDFVNKPKGLMKKNYLFLTKDGKVKFKNLGVAKKDTSALTRYIFRHYIIEWIKEQKKVKFSKSEYIKLINILINENIEIVAKRFKVFKPESYKLKSQLQCKIAEQYGAGIHFLIKNKRFGVGGNVKYCTIDEFKQHKMSINDLDLSSIWSELEYFIEPEKVSSLSGWLG